MTGVARTEPTALVIADNAIGLYLEYLHLHGYDPGRARAAAVLDVVEGSQTTLPDGPHRTAAD